MKKTILLFVLIFSMNAFAQIRFEKAYFIDNVDNRVDCLIKNADWKNNPDTFNYKLNEDSDIKTASVKEVKLFEIQNQSKFVRATVDYDKSSIDIKNLSLTKEPEFVQRQLFLKQIVNGSADLYKYEEGNNIKFFYQKGENEIKPLIYKSYAIEMYQIAHNVSYKQQLSSALTCATINKNQINNTPYVQKNLVNLFQKYNQCADPDYEVAAATKNSGSFHLSVRPRVSFSSLQLSNSVTKDVFEFGNKTEFGFGIELEYVFPFNKNKWAIIAEPTYRAYKAESVITPHYMAGNKFFAYADYKSVEVPIGIRHYMYLDTKSKVFLNVQYVFDLSLDSSLEVKRADDSVHQSMDVKASPNFAIGAGYSYSSKYGVEIRYFTDRNIIRGFPNVSTSYKSMSLVLSYNVF